MAELFKKMGYDVELTKETRDGGKDIYIAQKTDIGNRRYYCYDFSFC